MSATARVADVLGDVNGRSSRTGRWPGASWHRYCARSHPGAAFCFRRVAARTL